MKKIRELHLYLGCLFAPMLVFFAVSGIWQLTGTPSRVLHWLSAIHTSARFKDRHEPSSAALRFFVISMALSFVLTTVLGVEMAFKFGRNRKAAPSCLVMGVVVPVVLVLLRTLVW